MFCRRYGKISFPTGRRLIKLHHHKSQNTMPKSPAIAIIGAGYVEANRGTTFIRFRVASAVKQVDGVSDAGNAGIVHKSVHQLLHTRCARNLARCKTPLSALGIGVGLLTKSDQLGCVLLLI